MAITGQALVSLECLLTQFAMLFNRQRNGSTNGVHMGEFIAS